MTIIDELKPCPFCGKQPLYRESYTYPNGEKSPAYIHCRRCGISMTGSGDNDNAVSAWNTRPQEAALEAIIADQENALNQLLQPGMRWVELYAAYKAADKEDRFREWWEANGDSLELARQRLFEALKEVVGKMRKTP